MCWLLYACPCLARAHGTKFSCGGLRYYQLEKLAILFQSRPSLWFGDSAQSAENPQQFHGLKAQRMLQE